jgi:hypothetical protein
VYTEDNVCLVTKVFTQEACHVAKPRREAMVRTLLRLTREYFEDDQHTPLDYAIAWQERGRTLVNLAKHVTETINGGPELKPGQFEVSRHMLAKYLEEIGGETTLAKLANARRSGAHGLVEEGCRRSMTAAMIAM